MDKKIELSSGYKIPMVGLGTYKMKGLALLRNTIRSAISMGYRHIDTAYKYSNESDIGIVMEELLNEGVIKREDVFITSKLWCTQHKDPEASLNSALKRLRLEYLDLYLVHYPVTYKTDDNGVEVMGKSGFPVLEEFDVIGIWGKMEALAPSGKVRSIGVSNFGVYNLNRVLAECRIKPAVAQFELHPYLKQKELIKLCRENGVAVVAYSSLGSTQEGTKENIPVVRNDKIITSIGEAYKRAPSQVILSYLVQQGVAVIPKSTSPAHLRENIDLFELEKDDRNRIDSVEICYRYIKPAYLGKDAFK